MKNTQQLNKEEKKEKRQIKVQTKENAQ